MQFARNGRHFRRQLAWILDEERSAAGGGRELREDRRARPTDRDRVREHVAAARAIEERGRLCVAVPIDAVRQQDQRSTSLCRLNRVDRPDRRVVERRRAPRLDPIDRGERGRAICGQRRRHLGLAPHGDHHHLVARTQRSNERARGILDRAQAIHLPGGHAEAAIDADGDG